MKKILLTTALLMTSASVLAADMKICVEGAYPPFSQTEADGTVTGFDIDIANAVCDDMGKSCEMVKVDWDGIIPALLEKKCDAIIASMSITPERQEVVTFSKKYQQAAAGFVGIEGLKIADIGSMNIGVQRATIHQAYVEGTYPDANVTLYGTQDEALLDLTSGRVDVVAGDTLQILDGFIKTDAGAGYEIVENADVTDPAYHGEGAGIAVRKEETELADAFSASIMNIRENGKYAEINDAYFEIDAYGAEM